MKSKLNAIILFYLFGSILFAGPRVHAQEKPTPKIKAEALLVEDIHSADIELPAEFQMALYENLVQQLERKSGLRHIYRDGDHNAANSPDVVFLRSTVRTFEKGSERTRQVTTIAGSTSITVHCEFVDKQGKVLLQRNIQGKVRFMGGNLKATYDFAKKAATLVRENFSAT